jgi:sporulation integral membrane protein YlbJ
MKLIKKYKSKLLKGLILFFFILMFLFPYASYKGASSGLMLWFINVLPTLLPFIIVSNLMIRLNIAGKISKLLYPLIGRLFRVSPNGSYPILIGFLSGLPMGAKTVADLATDNKIGQKESHFLLIMCNNASPIFIMSYIALNQLKMPKLRIPLFMIIYGSSILSAIIYRIYRNHYDKRKQNNFDINISPVPPNSNYKSVRFSFDILDKSIMDGFEVVTKIGGYIILFSILAQIINEIGSSFSFFKAMAMGLLEITTGVDQICKIRMDSNIKIVLVSFLASFGGLSGLAQTKSVLGKSRLSIKTYFLVKLLSSFIAILLALLYVLSIK